MIYSSRFLRPGGGRLGNAFFQIASLTGFSHKFGVPVKFPSNDLFQYLRNPPEIEDTHVPITLEEKTFSFDWSQWDKELIEQVDVDIKGWLQNSKYWEDCKEEIIEKLQLKPQFTDWVRTKYASIFTKPTIAISIRRGDYVKNQNYELLPIRYYLGALLTHFPDFRDNYNIVLFSDDIQYCMVHFSCLKNAFFIDSGDPIEQHALMRMCDNFIIANSTFSYWGAYLSKAQKMICPKYHFAGELLTKNGDVNFFEKDWIVFDHKNFKIDLADTTFIIPVYHDHEDRDENIHLAVKMLKEDFNCKIIVGENKSHHFSHLGDKYIRFNYQKFHRTKMLNQMVQRVLTPFFINYDTDVLVPPLQLLEAIRLLRSGENVVYPYDGRFARVPRSYYKELSYSRDVGILTEEFKGTSLIDELSVGGAVAFVKWAFLQGGGENEKFVSYGPEDKERWERYTKFIFHVERVKGIIYHIDHAITSNSSMQHEDYKKNSEEYEKCHKMTEEQLRDYVDTWNFNKYSEEYQLDIFDPRSASEVLGELRRIINFTTVIDAGCGSGSWQTDNYTGIDCNIPYPDIQDYIEADLGKPLPDFGSKWDLCLCMEVAEHINRNNEDVLIRNLCKLSDKILFSAAIPGQGGENHVNEQWQEYWAAKFRGMGYFPFWKDVREGVWNNPKVATYYKQNMVLYTKYIYGMNYELNVVHPQMYTNLILK